MDKQTRYEGTVKGKAARERAQAKRQAKREAMRGDRTVLNRRGESLPTPKRYVRDKYAAMIEANDRVYKNHMANGRTGMAVEVFCRSWKQTADWIEESLKPTKNDPRTTPEEWAPIAEALTGVADRARMIARWMSKNETLEERKYRLAHGMFLDEGDPDFLKELLLGKPTNDER